MLIFLAICYASIVWLIYFKLKLLPYDRKNKIISTLVGIILLAVIFLTLLAVAPYSKNVLVTGKVNAIAPRVSGIIESIFIQPGVPVKEGTPLFQLNTIDFDNRVEHAKGTLATAKASYEKALKQRKIALDLQAADPASISQLQLINTEETLNELKGKYESAKSALEQALFDRTKTTVTAPSDGFTPFIAFKNETTVNAYAPIMTFISLIDLHPTGFYRQNTLALVKPGDDVEFILDIYPGHIFTAKVDEIVWAAGEAQVFQGHDIPEISTLVIPEEYGVKLKIEESDEDFPLHFGARGQMVVYTQHVKPLHIIYKIYIRMQAWLKYLAFP